MSERKLLNEGTVEGNIKKYDQKYEIYYYPREGVKCDKIAIYFIWLNEKGKKKKALRSTFFANIEDLKEFKDKIEKALKFFAHKRHTQKKLQIRSKER